MDSNLNEWLNLVFRWIHVLAGVMWIGHLWFFNFVNAQLAKTYDADSRKKVVPELMPRALYWFRWGAAYTWVTGILLLWVVYWPGLMGSERMSGYASGGIGLLIAVIAFVIYDVLWKGMKNETTGGIVSLVLFAVLVFVFHLFMGGRAMFIYAGGTLGTIMAANVWMRIWPLQKKIITAVRDGTPPDPTWAPVAAARSRHNTYLSVPLVWTMINSHTTVPFASSPVYLFVMIVVGWGAVYLLYQNTPRVKGF